MTPVHFHLLGNHIPLIVLPVGLALLVYGIFGKKAEVARASLVVIAVAALIAIPVYLSGEGAEETVERLPGVAEAAIERHEESALPSLIAIEAAGFAAIVALVLRRKRAFTTLSGTAAVISLVALVLIGWTAFLGGQIRHTEITGGPAAASDADHED